MTTDLELPKGVRRLSDNSIQIVKTVSFADGDGEKAVAFVSKLVELINLEYPSRQGRHARKNVPRSPSLPTPDPTPSPRRATPVEMPVHEPPKPATPPVDKPVPVTKTRMPRNGEGIRGVNVGKNDHDIAVQWAAAFMVPQDDGKNKQDVVTFSIKRFGYRGAMQLAIHLRAIMYQSIVREDVPVITITTGLSVFRESKSQLTKKARVQGYTEIEAWTECKHRLESFGKLLKFTETDDSKLRQLT